MCAFWAYAFEEVHQFINMRPITVIPGDGIGPEVIFAMKRVVLATGVPLVFEEALAGLTAESATGSLLPKETLDAITRTKIAIKGPTGTPIGGGHKSINVLLRKHFDLFANVRPVANLPGIPSHFTNVDLIIFRENTEDLYIGEGSLSADGEVAEALCRITRSGSERIARYAFEYARAHGRHKVSVIHKANIIKEAYGLFLRTAEDVARSYPDIAFESVIVDNFCARVVGDPTRYDCILAPNLFGDILSDLCAALVGGLGVAPGANIGRDHAIFEAVHGTAPDIAGRGIANPTAIILSAAMMLRHIGADREASRIENAVRAVFAEGRSVTGDIDRTNPVSTNAFADAVIAKL